MPTDHRGVASAEKDCPKCRSRRIQCDRTLPECRKCGSRGLKCPGYGIILRWGQGVASRGRLAGQQLPIRASESAIPGGPRDHTHPQNEEIQTSIPNHLIPLGPHAPSMALELVHHYEQNVAGKLAWVDGPRNPWRQVIIPLAWSCPTIFDTILSLSSEDLARRYGDNDQRRLDLQLASLRFRNKALSLLVKHISSIRETHLLTPSDERLNEARFALASTLILYNVELLGAEAVKYRMHLKGARVIHQWFEQSFSAVTPLSEIDKFLLYEHYYSSVFADLTTFDTTNEPPPKGGLQITGGDAIFGEFVREIQLVTKLERVKHDQKIPITAHQIREILHRVEMAKDSMISFSEQFYFWNGRGHQDFQHLIFIFYHAIQMYTHRAISDDPFAEDYIHVSRVSIVEHLNQLSDKRGFAHDLTWPLFILGTESRDDKIIQHMVSVEMESVMKISGDLDRKKVLSFLQQYWSADITDSVTWIQFMRKIPGNNMLIL